MNPLILWRLKKYCTKHELDPEQIDYTLSYEENLIQLKELARDFGPDIDRWLPELDKYFAEREKNFLYYYMDAAQRGETESDDVGPPVEADTGFSLAAYIQSFFGVFFTQRLNVTLHNLLCRRK